MTAADRLEFEASDVIERVSVLTWNVGHRAGIYPNIPSKLIEALRLLDADVVLLNEFYDDGREDRELFRHQLADIGYLYCDQSAAERRQNRIFVASRLPFESGDIAAPYGPTSHATTNFHHIRLKNSEIELIGLRRPDYRGAARRLYWDLVGEMLAPSGERALVIAGDLNENLFRKTPSVVTSAIFPFAPMYTVPRPDGDWSYTNLSGTAQTAIDHVAHTERIRIREPRYRYERSWGCAPVWGKGNAADCPRRRTPATWAFVECPSEVGGIALAAPGPLKAASLSDHAPLTFIAELASRLHPCSPNNLRRVDKGF